MRRITHIIVHCSGAANSTVDSIRRFHTAPKPKGNGWKDIGYHYVIHVDGSLHSGRPVQLPGAHVADFNAHSLGVCVTGNGDIRDFNEKQYETLIALLRDLSNIYSVPIKNVLGHRETRELEQIPPKSRTKKSCPGTQVSMALIRQRLEQASLVA